MKAKYIKWFGLIGATFAGTASIMSGDVVTGIGVISAALSSAGILPLSR